jgi:hypothetical protein
LGDTRLSRFEMGWREGGEGVLELGYCVEMGWELRRGAERWGGAGNA